MGLTLVGRLASDSFCLGSVTLPPIRQTPSCGGLYAEILRR
jgi:hypothetical protein